MTGHKINPGIAAKITAASDHARDTRCPRCNAPVITALAGRIAALHVIADPQPITPTEEILTRLDGRLTWFLVTGALGTRRITWRSPAFAPHDKHPVLADHRCPPQPRQETLL